MRTQAVMFDIDDTLIDVDTGLGIQYAIDLLNRCAESGLRIIIITARPYYEQNYVWTEKQLMDLDIYYDELWFCPAPHKNKLKLKLGYDFLISVGDQLTDLGESHRNILISKH